MRRLAKKIQVILNGSRGESLMECIASIFVFTILLACVTMMIMVSMRVSSNATRDASSMQTDVNAVLSGAASCEDENVELRVNGVSIDIPVVVYRAGDFAAFFPRGDTVYD